MLQGPDKGRTYLTEDGSALIGRSSEQISLTDHTASRRHAEIHRANGSWVLTDLQSANGTYLNGQRIVAPSPLKHGDQIKIGSTLLVFSGGLESGGATTAGSLFRDLVEIDEDNSPAGSSIVAAIDSSEESIILQPPETADAVSAWNIIYRVAELIGTTDSATRFLEGVAEIVFRHLPVDHLVILMADEPGAALQPALVRFRGMDRGRRSKIVTSQTIVQHVLRTRDGVLCANALTDSRFSSNPQDSLHRLGLRSIICVPIVSSDHVHGVFHLDCSMARHTFTQEQLRLAVAIGRLTGMALENARLMETRVRTERLAATGETVAYLSHHIRNILQGMQGGADVIELALQRNNLATAVNGWAMMKRNLDRILHLTLNMLTFSKQRKPRIELAQLNAIVADVLSLSASRAAEKSVELVSRTSDIPAAPLDPEGMHQVIHNIVLNAVDVAPSEGGRVEVATQFDPDTETVSVSISDNGPGISPEERAHIFRAFHSSKGHAGTGLGLAAAMKIVAEMGGRIDVESELGTGATFHVRIPTKRAEEDGDSDQTHGPAATPR